MDNRRKIGQDVSDNHADNIAMGSDMVQVPDMSSGLDPSQAAKLQEKSYRMLKNQNEPVKRESSDFIEVICDNCAKPFVCKRDDLLRICTNCGAKHRVDADLEEVKVVNPNEMYQVLQDKVRQQEAARAAGIVIPKDKSWQDSRKEQISLEPGSPEYREYLEDLMENDPGKEDDAMHAELESYNEDLVTDDYDAPIDDNQFHEDGEPVDPNLDPNKDTVPKRERREMDEKLDVYQLMIDTLMAMTLVTPAISDDIVVRSDSLKHDVVRNRSITAEEFQTAAEDYVMESSF